MKNDIPWRWFHTFTADKELENQGRVIVVLPNGDLRIQFYSFMSGEPTEQEVWLRDDLPGKNMRFYESNQEMLLAYDDYSRRRR